MNKEWWFLLIAGAFEVVWVAGLKYSTTWWQWTATAVIILISFKVLLRAAEKLPVGTMYAVFTGVGTAGTVITEIFLFNEPVHPLKILFIALLTAGIIGLKFITSEEKEGAS